MSVSNGGFVAWWGATLGTLSFLWNVVTYLRAGPRVKVRATTNMRFHPHHELTGDRLYIMVTAVNHGTAPTTITNFVGFHGKSFLAVISKKRRQNFAVITNPVGQSVPHVLNPGEQWMNILPQEGEPIIKERLLTGYVCVGVLHTRRKRGVYVRVRLDPKEEAKLDEIDASTRPPSNQ